MLPLASLSYEHFYNKSWRFRFWFANFLLANVFSSRRGRTDGGTGGGWLVHQPNPTKLHCDLHATYGLRSRQTHYLYTDEHTYMYVCMYIWEWVCIQSSSFGEEINLWVFTLLQLSGSLCLPLVLPSASSWLAASANLLRIRQVWRGKVRVWAIKPSLSKTRVFLASIYIIYS